MKQRIRAAGLVVRDDRLLLVRHKLPRQDEWWWSPPGGGVEGIETLFAAAEREVWEETNLRVRAGRIAYVQELVDAGRNRRIVEFFVVCDNIEGELLGEREGPPYTLEARFLSPDETRGEPVLPGVFRSDFWDDLAAGFPDVRYLGLVIVG